MRTLLLTTLLAAGLAGGCASATKSEQPDSGSASGPDAAKPPGAAGYAGHGFVAGGVVAQSAHYKLVGSLTAGQGTSSSAHYTQLGGVLGATQK